MLFATASAEARDLRSDVVEGETRIYEWKDRSRSPFLLATSGVVPAPSIHVAARPGMLFTTSEDRNEGQIGLNEAFLESRLRPTGGQGAVHASIDHGCRFIAVANYREEKRGADLSVAVFPFDENGRLGDMTGSARHEGSGPDKTRQSSPHTHCVMFSPDNRLLAAVDLGTDGLWLYHFDASTPSIWPGRSSCPPDRDRGIALSIRQSPSFMSAANSIRR